MRQYFEFNNVTEGLFKIYQLLFGVRFEKVKNASVWHEDVQMFSIFNEETNELIGIDKAICSSIEMIIVENQIDEIIFYTNPEGKVYPEKELQINEKILNGFNWRIIEKIKNKVEITRN